MKKVLIVLAASALTAVTAFGSTGALSLVPNDAITVGVVRLVDVRSSPLSSSLFEQTDKITADGEANRFLSDAGLQPTKDVDVVVVSTRPRTSLGHDADVLIAADGRFNVDRLTSALVSRGAKKTTVANGTYFILPRESNDDTRGAVAFPSARLAIIGTETAVTEALGNYASGGTSFATASGLGHEIGRIDPHATAWALIDVTRARRLATGPHIPSHNEHAQALSSALKSVSTVAMWATDTGDSLKLNAIGLSNDAETLQLLEDTIRGALAAMRLAAQDKSPDLVSVLRRFTVSRTNDAISVSGSVPADTFREYTKKNSTR